VSRGSEEPDRKSCLTEHGTVDATGALCTKGGLVTPQSQEISVELSCLDMSVPLPVIQLAALEGRCVSRIGQFILDVRVVQTDKLRQKFPPAFSDEMGQLGMVIRKKQKRCRGRKFLTLEQHGCSRCQKQQSRHRPPATRIAELMTTQAFGGIRDLIVVLQKQDRRRPRQVQTWSSPTLPLP
jgi:hypothetical protein